MQKYPELSLASHWQRGGLCQWTNSDWREKTSKLELNENTIEEVYTEKLSSVIFCGSKSHEPQIQNCGTTGLDVKYI